MNNRSKVILDLCGGTGSWSWPYSMAGYDVRNITLPDYDVRDYEPPEEVYGILAAPPCTMFSFARTLAKTPRDLRGGMELIEACLKIIWTCQYKPITDTAKKTRLKFWALENPRGLLQFFLGKPVLEFDPCDFGDRYTKKTHLWGNFNIPKMNPIILTDEEHALCKTNSRRLPDVPKFDRLLTRDIQPEFYGLASRQIRRAITPRGFAQAFYEANR